MVFTKLLMENALTIRPCNCKAASEPLLPKVACCIPVLPSRHIDRKVRRPCFKALCFKYSLELWGERSPCSPMHYWLAVLWATCCAGSADVHCDFLVSLVGAVSSCPAGLILLWMMSYVCILRLCCIMIGCQFHANVKVPTATCKDDNNSKRRAGTYVKFEMIIKRYQYITFSA